MLDAFVIERINRKNKRIEKTEERMQLPLYIEQPNPSVPITKENKGERGVAIIDFTI